MFKKTNREYCMSRGYGIYNNGYFYEALEEDGWIYIIDSIGTAGCICPNTPLTEKEFKDNFYIVDKSVFDVYELMMGEDIDPNDLRNLVRRINGEDI